MTEKTEVPFILLPMVNRDAEMRGRNGEGKRFA
jgi:hypothetical protein